jgi:hypothetical protein
MLDLLTALEVLGGTEIAAAALQAVAFADEEIRDRAFGLAEANASDDLAEPLIGLLEEKAFRRDVDLKARVCKALAVVSNADAVPALTELVRTDEDATVVAAAADALATFRSAPLADRKEAVKRLVDVLTTTWNLMMSIREEDRVIRSVMRERYRVYGRVVRDALQALTGAQLSRPQEWREWWNANKKRNDW